MQCSAERSKNEIVLDVVDELVHGRKRENGRRGNAVVLQ
jgi:hypothetical protein